jgi:hypothetical protein
MRYDDVRDGIRAIEAEARAEAAAEGYRQGCSYLAARIEARVMALPNADTIGAFDTVSRAAVLAVIREEAQR